MKILTILQSLTILAKFCFTQKTSFIFHSKKKQKTFFLTSYTFSEVRKLKKKKNICEVHRTRIRILKAVILGLVKVSLILLCNRDA